MARKSSATTTAKSSATAVAPAPLVESAALPGEGTANKSLELSAAAHEALSRHYGKLSSRDALTAGAVYSVSLAISGQIDGEQFDDLCVGSLLIGHDSQSATSHGPSAADLLAVVLAKLNTTTREKFLREIAAEYSSNGNQLPEVDTVISAMADATLKAMRASETITRRGAVKFSPAMLAFAK